MLALPFFFSTARPLPASSHSRRHHGTFKAALNHLIASRCTFTAGSLHVIEFILRDGLWHHCGTFMAPAWFLYGTIIVPYGTFMAPLWHPDGIPFALHGTSMASLWHPCGTFMAHYGNLMVHYGILMVRLWYSYGTLWYLCGTTRGHNKNKNTNTQNTKTTFFQRQFPGLLASSIWSFLALLD